MSLSSLVRIGLFSLTLAVATAVYGVFKLVKWIGACAVVVGAFMAFVIGTWDFAVWLFKADWRTTHGQAPMTGMGLIIVGSIVYGIGNAIASTADELRLWARRQPEMLSDLERVLVTYEDGRVATFKKKGQVS